MDHEASVGVCMLIAQALQSSTTQASYAMGLSTDSLGTFGIAIYIEAGQFLTVKHACITS